MIVDSSAIIAILDNEPEAGRFLIEVQRSKATFVSAVTVVEAKIVSTKFAGDIGPVEVDRIVESLRIEVISVDGQQAAEAFRGFMSYGKGRHPAGLNLGDCFVYGLAKTKNLPILCKGSDFPQTDALIA